MCSSKNRLTQIVVDITVIISIVVVFAIVYFNVQPNIRGFYCNDDDILYPEKVDIVPDYAVAIYGILGTIIIIIIIELINIAFKYTDNDNSKTTRRRQFMISNYHGIALFLLGLFTTLLVTEIGKRWVGRLRPHFIDVCKPDLTAITCSTANNGVLKYVETGGTFCKGDAAKVKEARLSWPSGHASISCYAMLFLIIYVQARLNTLKFRYIKLLIQITALIAAFVTSISRVQDHHHRGSDVISGAILGIAIALFMTLVHGRVIWLYRRREEIHEFDLKTDSENRIEMY